MDNLPTQKIAQEVFEAHLDLIWDSMRGMITDLEEFNEWANKMASAHTSTTLVFMYPPESKQTEQEIIDLNEYGFDPRTN